MIDAPIYKTRLAGAILAAFLCMIFAEAQSSSEFTANVAVGVVESDNPRAVRSELAEQDTNANVGLDLSADWQVRKHQFDLSYAGDYSKYVEDKALDYDDHIFSGGARFVHGRIFSSSIRAGYTSSHDIPGSTDVASGDFDELNLWTNWNVRARAAIGRSDSIGQIVGRLGYEERAFTNNGQENRDYDRSAVVVTYFHRITTSTRLLLEGQVAEFEYPNDSDDGFNQSNTTNRALAGISWNLSEATSGTFKLGYLSKEYNDVEIADVDGLTYFLEGQWQPNTFTSVSFGGSRNSQEAASGSAGGFVRSRLFARGRHSISPRTALLADISVGEDDFTNSQDRKDKRFGVSFGVEYSLLHWLNIGVAYTYRERDSTDPLFDFAVNQFRISARTNFE